MLAMRGVQHAQQARHADGAATLHRLREGHGLAVGAEEEAGRGGGRRRLPSIPGFHRAARGAVQQQAAAADAGGVRLRQRQHHRRGDRGIEGAAAGAQHLPPRFRRVRAGRHHHVALRGLRRGGKAQAGGGARRREGHSGCPEVVRHL
jgi:hypothetical protein